MDKRNVRMLLRVSSNQQLEADGDLSIQRQLVLDYIKTHEDWELDSVEYFEGSNSGYKNAVSDRDVLQQALKDAKKQEYDILVAYKDDRIGRRMWDIGTYVMKLKENGVDIYTVKDGCISPSSDDIMGQMMLALRYGNAQKSSSDTGMRVKDTAQKLIQRGKFMGGAPPYGYELMLSGEISKHGRALSALIVIPERADVVRHIYDLSYTKEYGSTKIAKVLNEDKYYAAMAPNSFWKSSTITSILTNPVYAGRVAYKRREHINGMLHRLDNEEWIKAETADERIQIIDEDLWNKVQDKRRLRGNKYSKNLENIGAKVMRANTGKLSLLDVAYCGYCGCKLTNGSRYDYWTIRSTGERRTNNVPAYKCQNAYNGMPHEKTYQFRANTYEPVVYEYIANYIEKLQENHDIFDEIEKNQNQEKEALVRELKKEQEKYRKIVKDIEMLESHIPDAMAGDYPLSLDELAPIIRTQKQKEESQREVVEKKRMTIENLKVTNSSWSSLRENLPTWKDVFMGSDTETKRVLVNKLIDRIDLTKERIVIRFKVNLDEFLPRINSYDPTTPYIPD